MGLFSGNVSGWVLGALFLLALVGVVVALATDDRDPSVVLAWLFVIMLFPVLGVILYFFLGRNFRRGTRKGSAGVEPPASSPPSVVPTPGERIASVALREGGAQMLAANDVELYFAGSQKFPRLLAEMAQARRYIHLMYLIWERDELTAQVTEVLLERLSAGVEVHIMYDWLTSIPYRKNELRTLARAGAVVVPCYRRPSQLNYRNHMKMVIIDGESVYSGGMNMGQEYIDGGRRFASWRDTSYRLTGPAVLPFLELFAAIWRLNRRPEDLVSGYLPEATPTIDAAAAVPVQVVHSSVSTRFPANRDVFIVALLAARQRVWIQSPYFVPDEPLLTAMCVAATSGVDVRLMMTGVPDQRVPFFAAHAYYPQLLRAGVRVYQYTAGFLHAKTVTVDDEVAILGTCNWDIRSLILHDEVVSVIHDRGIAVDHAGQFQKDLADCSEVVADGLGSLSGAVRFRNSVYRLFSRLL